MLPDISGDKGASLGWLQIWEGWSKALAWDLDPFDPIDAIKLGVTIRETRGKFGGAGGWTCADLNDIP
ncbi:MAG: hypothetical protein ACE5EF_13020 [Dehalococcoidia bacterium]